ncbi:hypothetical protein ACG0Z6_05145 [Roseateles sp. BYS180W]|uniref:Chloride channel protein n=1 Tax=Roseateles rivi TaxID=3299028 RepID=A0ABW7FTK2_9BURK
MSLNLVLDRSMKSVLRILLGTLAGLLAGTALAWLVNRMYVSHFVHGDDDVNVLVASPRWNG